MLGDLSILMNMGIGDLVMLEPILNYLLRNNIVDKIHLFTRKDAKELYKDYHKNLLIYAISDTNLMLREISRQRTNHIVQLTSASDWNHPMGIRMLGMAQQIAATLGINIPINELRPAKIEVSPPLENWAYRFINKSDSERILLWQAHASTKTKCLPISRIEPILEKLSSVGWRILLLGSPNKPTKYKYISVNIGIQRIAAICSIVDLVVSYDSALAYIAGATGKKVIALFGPTEPQRFTYGFPTIYPIEFGEGLDCYPCNEPCPEVKCLSEANLDIILDAIENIDKLTPKPIITHYVYTPSKMPIGKAERYRVMFVIPHMFLGGGETQLYYLIKELKEDFDISIVIGGEVDNMLYPVIKSEFDTIIASHPNKLFNAIVDRAPHVIVYHGLVYEKLKPVLYRMRNKPIIIQIIHNPSGPWGKGAYNAMKAVNDHVICVASWIRDSILDDYIPMSVVLNGVPYKPFKKREFPKKGEPFNLVIVSRHSPEKRIDTILESIKDLPNIHLHIYGWGRNTSELIRSAIDLGIKQRTFFYNPRTCDKQEVLDQSHAAILISDTEGNSMFVLEACMEGLPVIVNAVGAAEELFENKKSALITTKNPAHIAHAIKELSSNQELYERVAWEGYNVVSSKCTSKMMADSYKKIILSEIQRRTTPETILLERDRGIGDILMTTPMVKALRTRFPQAKILYRTSKENIGILEMMPFIDEYEEIKVPFTDIAVKYDLAIKLTHEEIWDTKEHIIDHYLKIIGEQPLEEKQIFLQIPTTSTTPPRQYVCLHHESPIIAKCWGDDSQWQTIGEYIKAKGYDVIDIKKAMGMSIPEVCQLIYNCSFLVAIDSMCIHIAKAYNKPTIAIYSGASSPDYCGYKENINLVANICKCNASKSNAIRCPFMFRCLTQITVDDVISAINDLIESPNFCNKLNL